jgi:tRNA-dependent cyclodipeptide synthase
MNSAQVKIKSSQRWKEYNNCHLGISIHNPNLTGKPLEAIIDWINEQHFKQCFIDLSDTLHRHNYMNTLNISEEAARKLAIEEGNRWLEENSNVLNKLNLRWEIHRWDHWLKYKEVQTNIKQLEDAFLYSKEFRQAILEDIKSFTSRQQEKTSFSILRAGTKYLIEEMGVLSYYFKSYPCAKIYPGKEQKSLKALRLGTINHQVPDGIQNIFYTQLWMHLPSKQNHLLGKEKAA